MRPQRNTISFRPISFTRYFKSESPTESVFVSPAAVFISAARPPTIPSNLLSNESQAHRESRFPNKPSAEPSRPCVHFAGSKPRWPSAHANFSKTCSAGKDNSTGATSFAGTASPRHSRTFRITQEPSEKKANDKPKVKSIKAHIVHLLFSQGFIDFDSSKSRLRQKESFALIWNKVSISETLSPQKKALPIAPALANISSAFRNSSNRCTRSITRSSKQSPYPHSSDQWHNRPFKKTRIYKTFFQSATSNKFPSSATFSSTPNSTTELSMIFSLALPFARISITIPFTRSPRKTLSATA